jgi:hypothetical protein
MNRSIFEFAAPSHILRPFYRTIGTGRPGYLVLVLSSPVVPLLLQLVARNSNGRMHGSTNTATTFVTAAALSARDSAAAVCAASSLQRTLSSSLRDEALLWPHAL